MLPGPAVTMRPAVPADRPALVRLLEDSDLTTAGIGDGLEHFVVAEGEGGGLIGVAGLEPYGGAGLLRSVAVAPAARGIGLGQALTRAILERAAGLGITDLYLLTTTAEGFFPRLGFRLVSRAQVPRALDESAEFQGACPETAVIMRRALP